ADTDTITIDPERLLELDAGESLAPIEEGLSELEFPINPERVAPILRRLILPTGTRARIYDRDGVLILDSRHLYSRGQILRYDLPPPVESQPGLLERLWRNTLKWIRRGDLPLYEELGPENGKGYPEVQAALTGSKGTIVRVNDKGEIVVSVAVPVNRFRAVLGVLLLSTQGGDIDAVLHAERLGVVRIFLVAALVTTVLSIILASTIAGPVRRLADAAERVRRSIKARAALPDFTDRRDEIGHLSGTLRDMTDALYARIEAIESFAADVAHELKNPLTSRKSAVDTLPLASNEVDLQRLIEIVRHDVRRLDRLISDISDASRLDAELVREDAEPVDIANLLATVISVFNDTRRQDQSEIKLIIRDTQAGSQAFYVLGHASRLGQVIANLLDNARSFSPPDGRVWVTARRLAREVEIVVEDEGPGIPTENLERIFSRFYTDRPGYENFGQNSGLGLSISRQIVESHKGRIWAENRIAKDSEGRSRIAGARMFVRLPVG
ncbi:MAG TPA: stimulus-sensing domain-containing protein, partial [Hyphomicrobiales bacterium]|nr:stimulus-sensing domain-containing protein [Hyphomicrobiales bacterium]